MGRLSLKFRLFSLLVLSATTANAVWGQSDEVDFSGIYDQIFQISVISRQAGAQNATGSGFQVSADGLIITNYHVISEVVTAPSLYKIEYVDSAGEAGELSLVDFDIINDLAILRHHSAGAEFLVVAEDPVKRGEMAYAIGNPSSYGMLEVPGPINGFADQSYKEQLLFSGSLNGGMSGGPAVNKDGEVIGVNVSSAGSQLSFLVPADKVKNLLARNRELGNKNLNNEIAEQIKAWQRPRIRELLDSDWVTEDFYGRQSINALRDDFDCGGDTNETEEERSKDFVYKYCFPFDDIYIDSKLDAGQIYYTFSRDKALKLNPLQHVRGRDLSMQGDNSSNYESSTDFYCETDFVKEKNTLSSGYTRVVTCLRAYKNYPGLYDSTMRIGYYVGNEIHTSVLGISAVEKDQIQLMNRRFMELSL